MDEKYMAFSIFDMGVLYLIACFCNILWLKANKWLRNTSYAWSFVCTIIVCLACFWFNLGNYGWELMSNLDISQMHCVGDY